MNSGTSEYLRSLQLLDEAEQTLRAIKYGGVDAFVVEEPEGHRVYTLEGADLPFSTLVERMQQGAAMLDARGCIVYCNLSLSRLLGAPREAVMGRLLQDYLAPEDHSAYRNLLQETHTGSAEGEMHLRLADASLVCASFSFSILSRDKSATGVLITDLRPQKQQIEFAAHLRNAQDEERKRIARELHDSVGQLLAAISMNISIVRPQAYRLDSEAARAISDNALLVERVSSEIRTISHLLHPPLLDVAGLASALRWYVDGFSERSHIKVDLEIPADLGRLPGEMEIAIFRVVQECLTNIHRHSGSASATIRIKLEGNRLLILVRDGGRGIPSEKLELIESGRSGIGFAGMRERLRQLGGSLEIQSTEAGTIVRAIISLAQSAA
jgi:PAS domain S-box-containing protein